MTELVISSTCLPNSEFYSDVVKLRRLRRLLMARLAESPTPYLKQEFGLEVQKSVQLQFRQDQVFALMRMGAPESGEVYRIIQQVCQENSLSVTRADESVGSEIILRAIVKNVLDAEFLIFDLSHERPNVYFELGYAFGVGNRADNVLLIAREETEVHFDIGLLRVHKYRSLDHLHEILSVCIKSMMVASREKSRKSWSHWLLSALKSFKRWGNV